MMFATAALLSTLAVSSSASASENGVWCAEPITLADKHLKTLPSGPNLSFRGQFKDFALFVEPHGGDVPSCSVFLDHHVGDDGLWVIEEPNMEVLMLFLVSLVLISIIYSPILISTHQLK